MFTSQCYYLHTTNISAGRGRDISVYVVRGRVSQCRGRVSKYRELLCRCISDVIISVLFTWQTAFGLKLLEVLSKYRVTRRSG